ncbi:MAG: hypothetical protein ACYC63_18255 [Armatimonadota bacterium]
MSRLTLLSLLGVLLAGITIGVIAGGRFSPASAQDAPAADLQALVQPSPVVSAVPFQSRTEYEQDPFEANRLRRTTTTVTRLVIVRADGSMELKETP